MKKTLKKLSTFGIALSLSILSMTTAFAGQWQQDNTGWKIQNENGSYLTNSWYQSPTSLLWYYMGADSYMLTNTTTPDGKTVDINGVWIQAPQSNTTNGDFSQEELDEFDRISESLGGKPGGGDDNIVDGSVGGVDHDGGTFNWQ